MVTPATNLEDDTAEAGQFNYIAAVCQNKKSFGLAYLDLGTGEFRVGEFAGAAGAGRRAHCGSAPRECVMPAKFDKALLRAFSQVAAIRCSTNTRTGYLTAPRRRSASLTSSALHPLQASASKSFLPASAAAGALLYYLKDNLRKSLEHLRIPIPLQQTRFMVLDKQTMRNLELVSSASGDRHATLYSILDRTDNAHGRPASHAVDYAAPA